MPKKDKTQKFFDSVTLDIIKEGNKKYRNIDPTTGVRYEQPLTIEHPELDVALSVAQPGTLLEKAMAPGVYKSIVNGLANGEGSQALFYGLIPEAKLQGLRTNYSRANSKYMEMVEPLPSEFVPEALEASGLSKAELAIQKEIDKIEKKLPSLEKKTQEIYDNLVKEYESHGWKPDFDFHEYAAHESGLMAAEYDLMTLQDIDPYRFGSMKYWNKKYPSPTKPTQISLEELPFKNGGKIKSWFK